MPNIPFQRGAISAGDCVGNAWNLVTNNFWLYIGMGALTLIMIGCVPLVSLFLVGPILGGFYYVVLRDMRGEPIEFGMLFKGFDRFVPLMVVGLIQAVPGIIAQVLRFTVDISQFSGIDIGGGSRGVGGLGSARPDISALFAGLSMVFVVLMLVFVVFSAVWHVLLFFAVPIILENDISPIEAIKLSISAATGNIGGLILLLIIEMLVALLGILAICLGYFVAMPVIYAANAFAFRQVFPLVESSFQYTPPPPSAYGSNFGSGME